MWEDYLLASATLVSICGILPLVFDSRSRVPLWSSVPKFLAGVATLPAHLSLGNQLTFASMLVMCAAWFSLVILRRPDRRPKDSPAC